MRVSCGAVAFSASFQLLAEEQVMSIVLWYWVCLEGTLATLTHENVFPTSVASVKWNCVRMYSQYHRPIVSSSSFWCDAVAASGKDTAE